MDFTFTTEQDLIRKTVREFCQKKIHPRVAEFEQQGKIPQTIIRGMADLGLLGMSASQEYGGAHADPVTVGLVAEEIARGDMSCAVPTFFLVQAAWGYVLDKYGAREAKEAILPHITQGNAFLGIAATEPNTGSDLAGMTTVAIRKGRDYVLRGEKMYISGVHEVRNILPQGGGHLTLVKTDPNMGTRGMSLFLVLPKKVSGVTFTQLEDWGRRGISTGGFSLDNVHIPESYRVGEENKGFYLAMEGFDYARALISLVCCGAAMSALDQAMDYITQRSAFGQPIGRFEGVQLKLAEHWARLDALRLLSYRALWLFDQEQRKRDRSLRFEVTRVCAEAKLLAPLFAFEAINDAIQWFGAFGYTLECPLYLALQGVRSYYWAEGAREIMGIIVARELLGKDFVAYR